MSSPLDPTSKRPPHSGGGFSHGLPPFDNGPFEPMDAIKWGFEVYRSDVARVALPIVAMETVILFATSIVPGVLGSVLRSALQIAPQDAGSGIADVIQYTTSALLGILGTAYAVTCLYPYLLDLARGHPVELSEAFRPGPNLLNALILVAILSVATSLGLSLCVLPGIAVMALSSTAFPALVDHNLDPLATIRECIEHAQRHFLPILFFGLLSIAVTLIGAALCAVGAVFVSVPVVMLAQIYVYLRLQGEVPVGAN